MNSNTLNDYRHEIYRCFGKAKDALFNLVDALASETGARSFPELSLSPLFERTWASLYEALEGGQIDAERLREVCVQFAPLPEKGQVVFLGIDTSNLYRPEAETAADRTLVKMANLPARDPCGQSRLGHQQCRAPAQASQSKHLRAGYGTCAFDGISH
jgi:hypothetical protein